jgi:hypothetical protein
MPGKAGIQYPLVSQTIEGGVYWIPIKPSDDALLEAA